MILGLIMTFSCTSAGKEQEEKKLDSMAQEQVDQIIQNEDSLIEAKKKELGI